MRLAAAIVLAPSTTTATSAPAMSQIPMTRERNAIMALAACPNGPPYPAAEGFLAARKRWSCRHLAAMVPPVNSPRRLCDGPLDYRSRLSVVGAEAPSAGRCLRRPDPRLYSARPTGAKGE